MTATVVIGLDPHKASNTIAVLERDSFFRLTESDHEIGHIIVRNILKIVSDFSIRHSMRFPASSATSMQTFITNT